MLKTLGDTDMIFLNFFKTNALLLLSFSQYLFVLQHTDYPPEYSPEVDVDNNNVQTVIVILRQSNIVTAIICIVCNKPVPIVLGTAQSSFFWSLMNLILKLLAVFGHLLDRKFAFERSGLFNFQNLFCGFWALADQQNECRHKESAKLADHVWRCQDNVMVIHSVLRLFIASNLRCT